MENILPDLISLSWSSEKKKEEVFTRTEEEKLEDEKRIVTKRLLYLYKYNDPHFKLDTK